MMDALLNRISIDPRVMTGKPVIRGTRIAVEAILQRLYGGMSETEILQDFPHITREDIKAARLRGS
ncbi:MAG TPA: DUF433 domain-containing protein [Rhizomicrobium sp.]|jgi:uncharacterized protein (DUF433 family)|nr:DUF433 domain-containing protein [Rhizomicrobium sp.]